MISPGTEAIPGVADGTGSLNKVKRIFIWRAGQSHQPLLSILPVTFSALSGQLSVTYTALRPFSLHKVTHALA